MGKGGKISPETEFKKGQSGNPNGRPKKLPALDLIMANVMGQEKDGITAAEAIIMKLREMATKGDIKAAQLLLDRGYGKAKQSIRYRDWETDRKSTRLNSSHSAKSRMPSSA